jgi:pimeloyl-ACP methyl ester carboxylesterase
MTLGSGEPAVTLQPRTIELHGHRIAYRAGGAGPVVVFVHGMAGSSATWDAVLPALAERFTVVAPDLLGHGDSATPSTADYSLGAYASTVRDLLDALGEPRATVVGQSLGGGIAMQFAYQFPDRCARLVLVDAGGLGREVALLLRGLTFPGVEYLFPVVFTSLACQAGNTLAGWLGTVGFRKSPQAEEMWRSYQSLVDPARRAAFVRTLRSVINLRGQQVSAHDRLHAGARIPTLIVWGGRDAIIPVEHAHAAHRALPHSRLEVFEDAGHYPHCDAPDRFVRVLTEFVHSTAPAAPDDEPAGPGPVAAPGARTARRDGRSGP